MCMLKELLNKATDNDRSLTAKLAAMAGCKVPALHKFIHEPAREFENFDGLLKMIRHLFPEREFEIMIDYADTLNVNKRTARSMLEYLKINRLLESFKSLLDRMSESDNKVSKEWSVFYGFYYELLTDFVNVDHLKQLREVRAIRPTTDEMKAMQAILESHAYYHLKEYRILKELILSSTELVNKLEDGFLKSSYQIKFLEMNSIINFRVFNDIESARNCANEIIKLDITTKYTAFAMYVKGMTYFFTDYNKSHEYLLRSKMLYEQIKHEVSVVNVHDSIETLYAYWNVTYEYTTVRNKYLFQVTNGQAVVMDEEFENKELAFFKLIDGIQKKDVNSLVESVIEFVKRGNSFFANIPKRELNRLGFSESFIDTLISMNN